ncbi:MAG: tetratricopeptide repeat protein [bacterium]
MPQLSDSELDQLILHAGRSKRKTSGPCPQPEDLIAYHQRELPAERMDSLREHFAWCEKCASELLQLTDFFALLAEAPATSERGHEVRWRKIAWAMARSAEGAIAKPEFKIAKWTGAVSAGVRDFARRLWPRPLLIFVPALVLLIFAGRWYALSQKPRYWDNPRYQALISPTGEVSSSLRSDSDPAADPVEQAKNLIRRGDFEQAGSRLRKYVAAHQDDWRAHYLLGLAHLSGARRIFIIDFYFDRNELDRAIASLQRAHKNAGQNEAAAEEIFWMLGRAYLMRGDYTKAADHYRAILRMQYPAQVRRLEAEKALRDLAAIHQPGQGERALE